MAAVFDIDAATIPADAAPGRLEKWDSLNHMNLVLALEQEFQLQFSDDDVMGLADLPTIIALLGAKASVAS